MYSETAPTICFSIYMAGDIAQAKQICREYCFNADGNACVHIEPVDFIYKGGEESGFKIGFIHYPKYPSNETTLREVANALAQKLMKRLYQRSSTVVGPTETEWFSQELPHQVRRLENDK
jgi:hypothetical protein